MMFMELITGALLALGGGALLLQAKPLPSEADLAKAKEILDKSPLDPSANTTVGKHMAFVQGDYANAMPYLVNSGDKTLKSLADHELDASYTENGPQKVGMGDEWVAAAKKFPALNKIFYERAGQWYGQAFPMLEGPWRDRTQLQLRKLFQSATVPDPKSVIAPAGWSVFDPAQKGAATPKASRGGKNSFQVMGGKATLVPMVSPIEQKVVAPAGRQVTVSGWVLSDGTESPEDNIQLGIWGQGGRLMDAKKLSFRPNEPWWQHVELTFMVPKDAVLIAIQLVLGSKTGTVYFDDLSIRSDGKELLKNGSFEDR